MSDDVLRGWHRLISRAAARRRRSRTLRNQANRVLRLAGLDVRVSHDPYCAHVEAPNEPAVHAALETAGWVSCGPGSGGWYSPWPDQHPPLGRKAARKAKRGGA